MIINAKSPLNLSVSVLNQGVYRTTDGGSTWLAATVGPPPSGALALALNPLFPATLYAGTMKQGVYVSTDSGDHWQSSNNGLSIFIRGVLVDPQNPANMYAASLSDGFFRSTNSGTNWSNIALSDRNLFGISFDPTKPIPLRRHQHWSGQEHRRRYYWKDLGQHNPYLFSMVVDPPIADIYTSSTRARSYRAPTAARHGLISARTATWRCHRYGHEQEFRRPLCRNQPEQHLPQLRRRAATGFLWHPHLSHYLHNHRTQC